MKNKIVFDDRMEFALKFTWEDDKPVWVNFQGVEVVGGPTEDINAPYEMYNYDMGRGLESGDEKYTFEDAYKQNKMLHGHIKWDGCMEIHDWSHHWCGYDNIQDRIVRMIYLQGQEIMGEKFDSELACMKNINK